MSGSTRPAEAERNVPSASAVFFWPSLAIALLAACAVLATLDAGGEVPVLGQGPGLTLDEPFNVVDSVLLVDGLLGYGIGVLDPRSWLEVFGDPGYNSDHPPLGRLLIGLGHRAGLSLFGPVDAASPFSTTCARLAPALAFAATVFLVGWCAGRWFGSTAGTVASLALLLMPRVFVHAHIASLETFMNLVFAGGVFYVADRWAARPSGPTWPQVGIGGLLWGLALLTKIQAVVLTIPIGLWALAMWRLRVLPRLIVLAVVGVTVFFAGWPWLWLDPVGHLQQYLGRAADRAILYCFYFGERYADRDVPWHYSFVMFAITVPLGLQLLGLAGGLVKADADATARSRVWLLLLTIVCTLAFFALPGITVYDGTRLFLVVSPVWAVLIGRGASLLLDGLKRRTNATVAGAVLALLLAAQGWGLVALHPVQLSYYNLLAGGTRGAAGLGMELSYWGDSLTRSFLSDVAEAVPPGSVIDVAPVLHPSYLAVLQMQPALQRTENGQPANRQLRAYDDVNRDQIRYAVVFRRRADPWKSLAHPPEGARLLAELRREGVQLAALYKFDPDEFDSAKFDSDSQALDSTRDDRGE
ncbi:MAG: ArnT family glycosyltransferase [Maioricimonas sp. JB045]